MTLIHGRFKKLQFVKLAKIQKNFALTVVPIPSSSCRRCAGHIGQCLSIAFVRSLHAVGMATEFQWLKTPKRQYHFLPLSSLVLNQIRNERRRLLRLYTVASWTVCDTLLPTVTCTLLMPLTILSDAFVTADFLILECRGVVYSTLLSYFTSFT